jgi:peptidoglycan/xylan/chitin deacetylase (PgdA/CDA1 family)
VVDNASTDATGAIAAREGCRVVTEPARGYVNALSAGFGAARGEIIACTDADSIVPPDWLDRIRRVLSVPGTGGCSGVFRFHDGPWWIRVLGTLFGRLNWHLAGANMAVRREAFLRTGGFSRSVEMGADVELGLRMKRFCRVIIDGENVVSTSSRRFQRAFWETIFHYYINDLFLVLFRRPLFYGFRNYRASLTSPGRKLRPASAFALVFLVSILVSAWTVERPASQMLGPVFSRGDEARRVVALTFDDGPGEGTDTVLAILGRYNVHATFFMIGKNVEQNEATARKVMESGNEAGNHTWDHPVRSVVQTAGGIHTQLCRTSDVLEGVTGHRPTLFRPPHGWRSPWMLREARKEDLTCVLWDVDSHDWARLPAPLIVTRVARKTRPGSIILFHDNLGTGRRRMMRNTVTALPRVIETLQKQGYRFVTVSEMIEERGGSRNSVYYPGGNIL